MYLVLFNCMTGETLPKAGKSGFCCCVYVTSFELSLTQYPFVRLSNSD